ncbi:hypothetical protein EDD11_004892 [Mortierella claussenii]|nr:hypothetical protein EDD11_004892 [Mortierella claussenii]
MDTCMDAVKEFHHHRLRNLLKATTGNVRRHGAMLNDAGSSLIGSSASFASISAAANKVFQIQELVRLILEFTPRRTWPRLCLVSKDFAREAQLLMWTILKCNSSAAEDRILPHLSKYAKFVRTIDIAWLDYPSLSNLLQPFFQLVYSRITTLIIHDSDLTTSLLEQIQQNLPGLRSVDLRFCQLDQHPLHTLCLFDHINSIAFSQGDTPLQSEPLQANMTKLWRNLKRLHIVGGKHMLPTQLTLPTQLLLDAVPEEGLDLEALHLEVMLGWTHHDLSSVISKRCRLTSLILIRCDISDDDLMGVSASLTSLKELKIRHCPGITAEPCLSILKACRSIRDLDLADFILDNDWFRQSLEYIPALESLALTDCSFSSAGLKAIVMGCRRLWRLNVDKIPRRGIAELFNGEPWSCEDLEELKMGGIGLGTQIYTFRSAQAYQVMWPTVGCLKKLRVLYLGLALSGIVNHERFRRLQQLAPLIQLQQFHLYGYGGLNHAAAQWIVEAFPCLEEFGCTRSDLSTPLLSWLRTQRPDLRLIE